MRILHLLTQLSRGVSPLPSGPFRALILAGEFDTGNGYIICCFAFSPYRLSDEIPHRHLINMPAIRNRLLFPTIQITSSLAVPLSTSLTPIWPLRPTRTRHTLPRMPPTTYRLPLLRSKESHAIARQHGISTLSDGRYTFRCSTPHLNSIIRVADISGHADGVQGNVIYFVRHAGKIVAKGNEEFLNIFYREPVQTLSVY